MRTILLTICFVSELAFGQAPAPTPLPKSTPAPQKASATPDLSKFRAWQKQQAEIAAKKKEEADRKAKEGNEKLRQERVLGGAGDKPVVGNEHLADHIVAYIATRMKDPDSLQIISWTDPTLEDLDTGRGTKWWRMTVIYRAKNGFGGYGSETATIYIKNDKVTLSSLDVSR